MSNSTPAANKQDNGSLQQIVSNAAGKFNGSAFGRWGDFFGVKTKEQKASLIGGIGSLANTFDQDYATAIDIASRYPWTTSNVFNRDDIPFIQLIEHRNEESLMKRQFAYYTQGIGQVVGNTTNSSSKGLLDVYEEMWPDNPTNWIYRFPYFDKKQFELSTPQWRKVDEPGQIIKAAGSGLASFAKNLGGEVLAKGIDFVSSGVDAAQAVAEAGLAFASPLVGMVDRPRIFTEHSERSVTIQFPLYNTLDPNDWLKNKKFFMAFAGQNHFNKRDFITGLPPVWYRVYVPNQYYSHASCVTNFTVENLGNTRLEKHGAEGVIVPDAYQISITLTEMLMPSLNQFQAAFNGDANRKVTTATRAKPEEPTARENTSAFVEKGKTALNKVGEGIVAASGANNNGYVPGN
jgi:hypothetical protein